MYLSTALPQSAPFVAACSAAVVLTCFHFPLSSDKLEAKCSDLKDCPIIGGVIYPGPSPKLGLKYHMNPNESLCPVVLVDSSSWPYKMLL